MLDQSGTPGWPFPRQLKLSGDPEGILWRVEKRLGGEEIDKPARMVLDRAVVLDVREAL